MTPKLGLILSLFLVSKESLALAKGTRQVEIPTFDRCPNGSVRHDNSCYFFSHELANWPDAMVYCLAYAGHLAFIEDANEQNFIAAQAKNLVGGQTDSHHYYWIGGTDAVSEGEWIWHTVYRKIQYNNWKPGEPNNDDNHDSHHQDCLAMYSETGLWDDGWCETEHNFICEIDLYNDSPGLIG